MPLLERDVENKVCIWAMQQGFICLKMRLVEDGWPDRLFISPSGHTIFMEFKRLGEKPRKLQNYRLQQLQSRGVPAFWVDNELTAVSILKEALESAPVPGASDQNASVSSIRGPVPGPRSGQDLNSLSGVQDLAGSGAGKEDADHSPAPADVQGVAGRDQEVD